MTKKQLIVLILIIMLSTLVLSACQGMKETPKGPAEVYWAYYEACQEKKFETARTYLSEEAQQQATALNSVCAFTHDAVNEVQPLPDGSLRTFSTDPEVIIEDDKAAITWLDDQGNLALVLFKLAEDQWKIVQVTWSK